MADSQAPTIASLAAKKPEGMTITRATAFVTQNAPKKAPPKPLGPPLAISPLIRTVRWTALIAGLTYGFYRNRGLMVKEDRLAEIKELQRPAVEANKKRDAVIRTRQDMQMLARDVGVPLPADFEEQYKIPELVPVPGPHVKH